MVAQDMTGYSPSGKISVYTDYADAGLTGFVRRVVVAYAGGAYTTDRCGYGCSDHASAYGNGFRESPLSSICLWKDDGKYIMKSR